MKSPVRHAFMLDSGNDPEELVENALLYRALKRKLGEDLLPLRSKDAIPDDIDRVFGRWNGVRAGLLYPQSKHTTLAYWADPTFLTHTGREFGVYTLDDAKKAVATLHRSGRDAFVKATKAKSFTELVPIGTGLIQALDGLEYSLCDAGVCLMVQEAVSMRDEYRIFVVDGVPVTGAGCIETDTPIENREPFNARLADDRRNPVIRVDHDQVGRYRAFAQKILQDRSDLTCTLDLARVGDRIVIVEMNPLHLGRVGLFACDIDILVDAVLTSEHAGQASTPWAQPISPRSYPTEDGSRPLGNEVSRPWDDVKTTS